MAKLVRLREWAVAGVLATTALLACVNLACAAEAAKPPAVLFTSGLHQAYFTKPLHAEGIELHTCSPAQLPERLPTGDYNAAVVTGGLADAKVVEALNAFMAAGGGVLLLYIAWKLLKNPPGAESGEHIKGGSGLLEAVKIIILADFVMSVDNMLAVAAASHGSFFLLMFGLGLSIPIILFCSALVAKMMNKWPWLVIVGAAILGWVSGEMIVADKWIGPYIEPLGKVVEGPQGSGVLFGERVDAE